MTLEKFISTLKAGCLGYRVTDVKGNGRRMQAFIKVFCKAGSPQGSDAFEMDMLYIGNNLGNRFSLSYFQDKETEGIKIVYK